MQCCIFWIRFIYLFFNNWLPTIVYRLLALQKFLRTVNNSAEAALLHAAVIISVLSTPLAALHLIIATIRAFIARKVRALSLLKFLRTVKNGSDAALLHAAVIFSNVVDG